MVLSFINHKGGTAKTTSTLNVGAVLASKGFKVLLVDLDGQANLTDGLAIERPKYTLLDVYKGTIKNPIIIGFSDNLHIIPTNREFVTFENSIVNEKYREKILKKILTPYIELYDYVLIDCPPNLNTVVANALEITDFVFIPMEAEFFSYQGLESIIALLGEVEANANPKLDIGGIFITKINENRNITKDITDFVEQKFGNDLMKTNIRISVKITESQIKGIPVIDYAPESTVAKDYISLTNEILERIV